MKASVIKLNEGRKIILDSKMMSISIKIDLYGHEALAKDQILS